MEVIGQLQKQYVDFVTSLYREGFLDDQFLELQKLRDDTNPDFVAEVVSLFFDDSEKLINNLATALHQQVVDYKLVDAHVHQFKGSSSSIGANKVKNACVDFRSSCDQKNIEGIRETQYLLQLKHLRKDPCFWRFHILVVWAGMFHEVAMHPLLMFYSKWSLEEYIMRLPWPM